MILPCQHPACRALAYSGAERRRDRVVRGPVLPEWERRLRAATRALPRKERRRRAAWLRMVAPMFVDTGASGWATLNGVDRTAGYL